MMLHKKSLTFGHHIRPVIHLMLGTFPVVRLPVLLYLHRCSHHCHWRSLNDDGLAFSSWANRSVTFSLLGKYENINMQLISTQSKYQHRSQLVSPRKCPKGNSMDATHLQIVHFRPCRLRLTSLLLFCLRYILLVPFVLICCLSSSSSSSCLYFCICICVVLCCVAKCDVFVDLGLPKTDSWCFPSCLFCLSLVFWV